MSTDRRDSIDASTSSDVDISTSDAEKSSVSSAGAQEEEQFTDDRIDEGYESGGITDEDEDEDEDDGDVEDLDDTETRDLTTDDKQSFQSQVTIPDLGRVITISANSQMTFDEFFNAINDRLTHINLPNTFKLSEYRLFNADKSRWIQTRVPYIGMTGISITDPNVYLLRTSVKVRIVLPNLTFLELRVHSDETVLRTLKYICGLLGIQNRYEEFCLVENLQNKSFDGMKGYDESNLEEVEEIFSELNLPDPRLISDYAIHPMGNLMKFRNNLTFSRLTYWLSMAEQGVRDGDVFYLRNANYFVSKGTTSDKNRYNAILAQAFSDFHSGIFDLSHNEFLNYTMGAMFVMLRYFQKSDMKAKKLNPLAGGKKRITMFKKAVNFLVIHQHLAPLMDSRASHKCHIVEGYNGKKAFTLAKDGNDCDLTLEDRSIKLQISGKESMDLRFNVIESEIQIVVKQKKNQKGKEKMTLLKLTYNDVTIFLKFLGQNNASLIKAYLDLQFNQARMSIKPLFYNPVFMTEFTENMIASLHDKVPERLRSPINLTIDQISPQDCMPSTSKISDSEKSRAQVWRFLRILSRDDDNATTMIQKVLSFLNFTKSFNKIYIYSDLALETDNSPKELYTRYKSMSADKVNINPEIISYSLEVCFDHFVIIPSLTKRLLERIKPRIKFPLYGIVVWKMKPLIGIDLSINTLLSPALEVLIKELNLQPAENRNKVPTYELKIEVSRERSPYSAHELLTSVRFYRQAQDNGKNVIREKDEGYLSSGLTQHKIRHFVPQTVS